MATQGLVTITRQGKVVMKFIAGCDGMNASKVAAALHRAGTIPGLARAYDMAQKLGFGSEASLVVMDAKGIEFHGDGKPSKLYRKTFNQPAFNPRWKCGTADHVKIIEL